MTDFELLSDNEFIYEMTTNMSTTVQETEDGLEIINVNIWRRVWDGTYGGRAVLENLHNMPDIFRSIPDVDTESLFIFFTNGAGRITVTADFSLKDGIRNAEDTGWTEGPDVVLDEIRSVKIHNDDTELEIYDYISERSMEFLKKFTEGVMEENYEILI